MASDGGWRCIAGRCIDAVKLTAAMLTVLATVMVTVTVVTVAAKVAADDAQPQLHIGNFSAAQAGGDYPPPWQPLTFKKIPRHTAYQLVEDHGVVVLQADSDNAASGLSREVAIDPTEHPIVEWRWKVDNVLAGGDVARKTGDDYPARLYITFAYDARRVGLWERAKYRAAKLFYGKHPPSAALNYLWASRAAVGTQVANAYTDRVQMFVVRSGAAQAGQWRFESRNVLRDYRAAFGDDSMGPPMISGVAVMTDTDNTGEFARAWFGDIVFKSADK